jgi:hypothetical protein
MNLTELSRMLEEHPEYRERKTSLSTYQDLYSGGLQMKNRAAEYLYRRHREPVEIFQERVDRAFYENYLGSIIDWFASTLFRREPIFTVEDTSSRSSKYYFDLFQDCDRNGTSVSDFFRKRFIEALVYGRAFVALEFPNTEIQFATRRDEESAGADRGFLAGIHPMDVVNWHHSEEGRLEWITILLDEKRSAVKAGGAAACRYLVYTATEFFIVETDKNLEGLPRIVKRGKHGCASEGRPPVFEIVLSEGLWLMNKAAHLQLEHFNKSNSLAWSLGMALYATPVIYSDKPNGNVIGESYYIHLGAGDKFGWTEPEGNVFRIAMENLTRLQEEIYRTCYLMGQSRSWLSGSAQVSGNSKRADSQITQEVLRAYGDTIKDVIKRLLQTLIRVRHDEMKISVSGLDEFEVGEFHEELEEAEKLLALGLRSKTFRKQAFKKLAFKFLADINESTKERIAAEIEQEIEKGD